MEDALPLPRPHVMTGADLRAAAALHASELPEGFLAQLGPRFLQRYLATFLDTPGGVALVVDDEHGDLMGFLVGSTRDGHHRAALQRHAGVLVLSALRSLAVRPVVLLELLRTRAGPYLRALGRTSRGLPSVPTHRRPARTAVLLNIAVSPRARGRGAGAALVREFEAAARADGCGRAVLISFGDKAFYEQLGWDRVSARRNARGQGVVAYRRSL